MRFLLREVDECYDDSLGQWRWGFHSDPPPEVPDQLEPPQQQEEARAVRDDDEHAWNDVSNEKLRRQC